MRPIPAIFPTIRACRSSDWTGAAGAIPGLQKYPRSSLTGLSADTNGRSLHRLPTAYDAAVEPDGAYTHVSSTCFLEEGSEERDDLHGLAEAHVVRQNCALRPFGVTNSPPHELDLAERNIFS